MAQGHIGIYILRLLYIDINCMCWAMDFVLVIFISLQGSSLVMLYLPLLKLLDHLVYFYCVLGKYDVVRGYYTKLLELFI